MYGLVAMACMPSARVFYFLWMLPVVLSCVSLSGLHPAACLLVLLCHSQKGGHTRLEEKVQLLTILLVAAVGASTNSITIRHFWRDALPGIPS